MGMTEGGESPDQLRAGQLEQIGRDSGIVLFGSILDKLFGFAFAVGIAKLYGLKVFGLFLLGLSISELGSATINPVFGNGIIRFVSLYRDDRARLKGIILTAAVLSVSLALALGLLLFFAAEPIVEHFYPNKQRLVLLIRGFAFTLPFSAATTVWTRTLAGLKRFKAQTLVRNVIEPGSKVAAALLLFLLGFKLGGLIWAYVISVIVTAAAACYYFSRALRNELDATRPILQFRELMAYGWPLLFRNLVAKASRRSDVLLLGAFRSSVDVALYGFASRLATINTVITNAFQNAYTPLIPRLHAEGRLDELQHYFQSVTRWMMMFSVPFFVIVIAFPGIVIPVLGQQFLPASTAVTIIGASVFLNYAVGPSETAIMMAGWPRSVLLIRMLSGAIALALNIFLVPRYGLIGAALALAASAVVSNALSAWLAYRWMQVHPLGWGYVKTLAAGGLAGALGFLALPWLPTNKYALLLLLIPIVLLTYSTCLCLLGLDSADRLMFSRLWTRLESAGMGMLLRLRGARALSGD